MRKVATWLAAAGIGTLVLTGCSSNPDPIADEVWSNVEAAYPEGIPADDPLTGVNDVEDVSAGVIRVNVQYDLSDAERQQVADAVQGLGYVDGLKTVVVRDASGLDSNHQF